MQLLQLNRRIFSAHHNHACSSFLSLQIRLWASPILRKSAIRHSKSVLACISNEETQHLDVKSSRGKLAIEKIYNESTLENLKHARAAVLQFLGTNFLPVALLSGVLIGLAYPPPGQFCQRLGLSKWTTSCIFILSGLTLRSGDIQKAVAAWQLGLVGLVSILLITPLAAIPVLSLKLFPQELIAGLAVFCCVPTTLSSGVSLTQLVGGNTPLALAMTVSSNLLGIVIIPFTFSSFVGRGIGISIPPGPLLWSLLQALLIPLLLGKVLRESINGMHGFIYSIISYSVWPVKSDLAEFVDGRRRQVSILTSFILSLVPWMQISCSKDMFSKISPASLVSVILLGIVIHVVYLVGNVVAMQLVSAYSSNKSSDWTDDARAVILVASQKTLPVSATVIGNLGGALGDAGLMVLPCVFAHLTQIIIDSVLVSIWLQNDQKKKRVTC